MRLLTALVAWFLLFFLFLVVRFPYRAAFEQTVARIEAATGADLTWEEAEVGALGVELQGFAVRMPSGASFTADRAWFRPAWGGLSATFVQTQLDGRGTARLNGSQLTLHPEKLQVQTDSPQMGTVVVTGDLGYNLAGREGSGELRIAVPKLAIPQMPEVPMEVGAKVRIQPMAGPAGPQGTEVGSEVSLFGQDITGGGTVQMRSQPGGRTPTLSGSLQVKTPLGTYTIRLSGTWDRPDFNVVSGSERS